MSINTQRRCNILLCWYSSWLTIVSLCLRAGWAITRVKERYLKYENAGDKLVGQTLAGIPPTSYEFGITPLYFSCSRTNESLVEEFVYLIFPIQHSKLISLSYILLATINYHVNWTVQTTPQPCPLRSSLYISFTEKYPNLLSFVKTSLPWENDPNCSVLTGIPVHCSMEVHTLQKTLPDKMMNLILKELDDRNMGQETFTTLHIRLFNQFRNQILISNDLFHKHLVVLQMQISKTYKIQSMQRFSNLRQSSSNNNSQESENDIQLISKDDGVWAHYWDGNCHPVPCTFTHSKS